MSASTKKRLLWAGGILLALVLLAVGMGVYYAGQAKRTLNQVTQPGASQREVSVYVLADDPAQDLSDAAGYLFGSLAGEEEAVARLAEALGGSPAVEEYPTAFAPVSYTHLDVYKRQGAGGGFRTGPDLGGEGGHPGG